MALGLISELSPLLGGVVWPSLCGRLPDKVPLAPWRTQMRNAKWFGDEKHLCYASAGLLGPVKVYEGERACQLFQ